MAIKIVYKNGLDRVLESGPKQSYSYNILLKALDLLGKKARELKNEAPNLFKVAYLMGDSLMNFVWDVFHQVIKEVPPLYNNFEYISGENEELTIRLQLQDGYLEWSLLEH